MRNLILYFIAFGGGYILLGLEITASRVLAPYFGNSIYVWGSLISVFLMALSIGYYIGGIVSDKIPKFFVLGIIMMIASLFILIIPITYLPVSIFIVNTNIEFRLSVLLACLVFFLIPSVLLGMVSPYTIKLMASNLETIGKTAGNVYSISTIGSISGAIIASFFLIPTIGTRSILYSFGITLFLFGIICMIFNRFAKSAKNQSYSDIEERKR